MFASVAAGPRDDFFGHARGHEGVFELRGSAGHKNLFLTLSEQYSVGGGAIRSAHGTSFALMAQERFSLTERTTLTASAGVHRFLGGEADLSSGSVRLDPDGWDHRFLTCPRQLRLMRPRPLVSVRLCSLLKVAMRSSWLAQTLTGGFNIAFPATALPWRGFCLSAPIPQDNTDAFYKGVHSRVWAIMASCNWRLVSPVTSMCNQRPGRHGIGRRNMTKQTVLLTAGVAVLALMLTACNGGGNGGFSQSGGCITLKEMRKLIKKKGDVSLHGVDHCT